ncbi:MAG: AAA family ATPase [Gammaproteobacteria bacterium]|nr:AAA family ATPase [Gammaproteobacteria bacterium]
MGKSTFLGCYKTLSRLANFHELNDANHFDVKPFSMGGYDTIVRNGCDEFAIYAKFEEHSHSKACFSFVRDKNNAPQECSLSLEWQDGHLEISRDAGSPESLFFKDPRFFFRLDRSHISYRQISSWLSRAVKYGHLPFSGDMGAFKQQENPGPDDVDAFSRFLTLFRSELPLLAEPAFNVVALDPAIDPRRRVYNDQTPPWAKDQENLAFLANFGIQIGLWEEVKVQDLEQGFAVMVSTTSGTYNLLDVGFGVHSILPLAQAFYEQSTDAVFLLQQPEVHLHPKAQAEFAQFIAQRKNGVVIETHSDHFLDRFRICVMRGELAPEDLSILYFQPIDDGSRTAIHSIKVDESANLLGAPSGFRDFFNHETNLLMGFKD